jgi:hypothetical protein
LRPYRPPVQSACSAPALMAAPIRSRVTSMPAAADTLTQLGFRRLSSVRELRGKNGGQGRD